MGRHDNLGKVLQETVDSCVEKIGFRKDGVSTSPMLNTTYASMDWDARVYRPEKSDLIVVTTVASFGTLGAAFLRRGSTNH